MGFRRKIRTFTEYAGAAHSAIYALKLQYLQIIAIKIRLDITCAVLDHTFENLTILFQNANFLFFSSEVTVNLRGSL